ncbi:hypothetical protein HY251_05435 [bacterium]|nr:hypothetical protein [bacterium]
MRRAMVSGRWAILVALVALGGCFEARPPANAVVPTLSFAARLGSSDPDWRGKFERERTILLDAAWETSEGAFQLALPAISSEYGDDNPPDSARVTSLLSSVRFHESDEITGKETLRKLSRKMLEYADHEHPYLVLNADQGATDPTCLLSHDSPVGVAFKVLGRPDPEEAKKNEPVAAVQNTLVVTTAPVESLVAVQRIAAKKDDDEKKGEKKEDPFAYSPDQRVKASVSTVLNSADTLDRIEYVTTYLYLYPFPSPPSRDIVLEEDMWRRFYALQWARGTHRDRYEKVDMRRAFEDMKVRIRDVKTLVVTQAKELGTLTRTSDDKLTVGINATESTHATPAANPAASGHVDPTLSYTTDVGTSVVTKLLKELEQRSTYINSSGDFLRITQRGMVGTNVAGRFHEELTLHVPAARELLTVLVPVEKEKEKPDEAFRVRRVVQPLYSRVDGLTVSVAVVRHPRKLRRSGEENFLLAFPDTADCDFRAVVTRPYAVTLWQSQLGTDVVQVGDLAPEDTAPMRPIYFTTPSSTMTAPQPLRLLGFTPDKADELLRLFREAISAARAKPPGKPGLVRASWKSGKNGDLIKLETGSGSVQPEIVLGLMPSAGSKELAGFAKGWPLAEK